MEQEHKHWMEAAERAAKSEDEFVGSLPPFNREIVCAKCGSAPKKVVFTPPKLIGLYSGSARPSHSGFMVYHCGYCCYVWQTLPLEV